MARLPNPGSDDGQWGAILNDYLGKEHNSDGSLRTDGSATLANYRTVDSTIPVSVASIPDMPVNGDLDGTLSNASIRLGAVGITEIASSLISPAAASPGLRTLGTGATQAAAGNHTHANPGITVQDEGATLATAGTSLNFVGAGVTASGSGSLKTITIPGGGPGGTASIVVQSNGATQSTTVDTLNFIGSGVSVSGSGNVTTVNVAAGGGSGAMGNVVRVVKNSDNTWPVRPNGAVYVEWVGVGAPDPPADSVNDTWVDLTP